MKKDTAQFLLCLLLFCLLFLFWCIMSYFEARAFNRITGKNVSTVDAMFVNLRVQEEAKDE
jgi:hypothetical protein